jgi:predicted transcriptional regulator
MKLGDYLTLRGKSPDAFAKGLGVSRRTVDRWVDGTSTPPIPTMTKVTEATDGEVTANDFLMARRQPRRGKRGRPKDDDRPAP